MLKRAQKYFRIIVDDGELICVWCDSACACVTTVAMVTSAALWSPASLSQQSVVREDCWDQSEHTNRETQNLVFFLHFSKYWHHHHMFTSIRTPHTGISLCSNQGLFKQNKIHLRNPWIKLVKSFFHLRYIWIDCSILFQFISIIFDDDTTIRRNKDYTVLYNCFAFDAVVYFI